jgi:hypothetical protein
MVISLFSVSFITNDHTQITLEKQPHQWVAHPMYISPFAGTPNPTGYSPIQMRTAYNLPSSGGAGSTIAIIDAYHTPNILSYYNYFSSQYNLPDNSTGNFIVHSMAPNIQSDSGWSMETCLDVEWAHAIAPNAKILLVEAVSPNDADLLSAIDYATSQPGVVAVSMSWGGSEFSGEVYNSVNSHFIKPGITFFASSGDDGTSTMWPAVSPNVVSVGGTTLTLTSDGRAIAETAWDFSSGGLSNYFGRPSYQTSYGLPNASRAVPDVSYNGNPSTGVAVYNGTWWKVGGTSAGAPQWAAIHALGLSATNGNLYQRAKSAYSAYFRDITAGSNGAYSAGTGYDFVTGLGSPVTFKFGTTLEVTPTLGPPKGSISLNGFGFTPGNSINISYLNPITSNWVSIINNFTTVFGNFTYNMIAPDLVQNSMTGDHQAQFDNIIFRAQDNSNNRSYNTTVPYTQGRRGLTQISNNTAAGLFGNNTNLASTVFVQNGQSIGVCGSWFSPGNASLLWDESLNLGTTSIDENGFINATVQVPITTSGQHRLSINDGFSSFCINLTRLPTVSNDYLYGWHSQDFTVNLTPDYPMNETFYRINDGSIYNLTSNGQPTITIESNNNTLEYWSTWKIYGTNLNEIPHITVTGIKLDKTAPTGSLTVEATISQTTTISLTLSATDEISGVNQMRFSNDYSSWSNWEPYQTTKIWTLLSGDGLKTVWVQFNNNAGLTSTYNCTLTLEIPKPTTIPTPSLEPTTTPTVTPSLNPTNIPIATPEIIPTETLYPETTESPILTPSSITTSTQAPILTPSPTQDSNQTPAPNSTIDILPTNSQTPQTLPEIPLWTLTIFVLAILLFVPTLRKKRKTLCDNCSNY